ncbi:hypothetical protein ACQ4PT_030834 [Festuca glaucescens]
MEHLGWGIIVRDHRGEVIAAKAGRTDHVSDAFHAELIAAVQAVSLAEQMGVIHIDIEMDSQLLMLALNRREADTSPQAVTLDDLKYQLRTTFSRYNVLACKHECNYPAHELANLGFSCAVSGAMLWEFECPEAIAGYVSGDMPLVDQ